MPEVVHIRQTTYLTTDDPEEAFRVLRQKRDTGETGWDMAEVSHMAIRPKTVHRWCVFRLTQE